MSNNNEHIYIPCIASEYNRSDKGTYSVTMLGSNGEQKFGYLKEVDPEQWVADMKAENERLKVVVESVKKAIYPSEAKYYDEMVAEIESILNKANY